MQEEGGKMNELVKIQKDQVVTSSRKIAEVFEKRHDNVLKDIDNLIEGSPKKIGSLFYETNYTHPQNKQEYREILMNRDGFTLLAMGFTGKKALEWKLKYIEAFNKMEEAIKKNQLIASGLSPQLQLLINMELKQKEMEVMVTETKEEVQAIRDTIIINPKAEWRKETNNILNSIGKKLNDYSWARNEVYESLKARANCRPTVLINNLKKRALENGMAPSKVDKLNILDVLENETRLREIYITIVKEMAIKYGVA